MTSNQNPLAKAAVARALGVELAEVERIKRHEPARYVAVLQAVLRGRA